MPFCNSTYEILSIGCAEFFGTAILVILSVLPPTTSEPGSLQNNIAAGLAVMAVLHIFGHISGAHVNPMTSIGAYLMDQLNLVKLLVYIACQITGGVIGFGIVKLCLPQKFFDTTNVYDHGPGMTLPTDATLGVRQIFFVEFLITFILAFANCASWDVRAENWKDSLALRFGFLVTTLNFVSVPYTGCSMNPARSFGPAFWYGDWSYHWVYWLAPISSSITATVIYKYLLNKKFPSNLL